MAHAASAAAKTGLFDEKIEGLFPSMRNPLDGASVAQSLDGVPSNGESASPQLMKANA
jgi:hypothetical protein